MKFELIGGPHVENGVKYEKGQIVESASELDILFKGKFRRIAEVVEIKNVAPAIPKPEQVEGVDATAKFPLAAGTGITILQRGEVHFVYKNGKPVNSEGFSNEGVKTFLRNL